MPLNELPLPASPATVIYTLAPDWPLLLPEFIMY